MASTQKFSLRFHKASVFKEAISAVANVLDEVILKIDEDGLKGYGMSPDKAVFIYLFFPSDGFDEFNVDKEVSFGVNVDEFKKVLSRAKSKDELGLVLQKDKFKVQFIRGSTREFELGILGDVNPTQFVELYENKLKSKEFNAKIVTDGTLLSDALKDAKLVGETITLKATEKEFVIECKGVTSNYRTVIKYDDPACFDNDIKEPSTSSYSLELLYHVLSGAKQEVSLEFSSNNPLKVKYNIDIGFLEAFIAPRVEE